MLLVLACSSGLPEHQKTILQTICQVQKCATKIKTKISRTRSRPQFSVSRLRTRSQHHIIEAVHSRAFPKRSSVGTAAVQHYTPAGTDVCTKSPDDRQRIHRHSMDRPSFGFSWWDPKRHILSNRERNDGSRSSAPTLFHPNFGVSLGLDCILLLCVIHFLL